MTRDPEDMSVNAQHSTGLRLLRRRSGPNSYVFSTGVVVGVLVTGLALPYIIGDAGTDTVTAGNTAGSPSTSAQGDIVAADEGTGAVGSATGPGSGSPAEGASAAPARVSGAAASGSAAGGGGGTAGSGSGTAERGVLPNRIKLGFTLIDVATVGRVGGNAAIDPEQQRAAAQSFVDEINERGGINGRMIEPHYRVYDILSRDDTRAACLELADDKKVFAVIASLTYPSPILCFVKEKQMPLFNLLPNNAQYLYDDAQGRLFTLYPGSHRMMEVFAAELDALGKLKGKHIGILSDDDNDPGSQVSKDLESILRRRGHQSISQGHTPASLDGTASQNPIIVNNFKRDGVEIVLMLMGTSVRGTQFAQAAESQQATWTYAVTDFTSNFSDSGAQQMPRSFTNAVLITGTRMGEFRDPNRPESSTAKACKAIYESRSSRKLAAWGTNEYALTMNFCDALTYFERAATTAGTGLTAATLNAGVQSLGPVPSASLGGGAFGPGKPDMNDLVRHSTWQFSCTCWMPVDQFHPGRG